MWSVIVFTASAGPFEIEGFASLQLANTAAATFNQVRTFVPPVNPNPLHTSAFVVQKS